MKLIYQKLLGDKWVRFISWYGLTFILTYLLLTYLRRDYSFWFALGLSSTWYFLVFISNWMRDSSKKWLLNAYYNNSIIRKYNFILLNNSLKGTYKDFSIELIYTLKSKGVEYFDLKIFLRKESLEKITELDLYHWNEDIEIKLLDDSIYFNCFFYIATVKMVGYLYVSDLFIKIDRIIYELNLLKISES